MAYSSTTWLYDIHLCPWEYDEHIIFVDITENSIGVAEDCCMFSTLPWSAFLYLQFLAWCHPYILLNFYAFCTTKSLEY